MSKSKTIILFPFAHNIKPNRQDHVWNHYLQGDHRWIPKGSEPWGFKCVSHLHTNVGSSYVTVVGYLRQKKLSVRKKKDKRTTKEDEP